ncbi:hypothetical protein [Clostridium sp.]|uniref:hypothetical protein n=1 Tax=Clostridium sp. TaxID=1506 RepID=UPI0025BD46F2|nr:hypothetical protein [Clostridium sp.]
MTLSLFELYTFNVFVLRKRLNEVTKENDYVTGTIDTLDIRFGSLWTNVGRKST